MKNPFSKNNSLSLENYKLKMDRLLRKTRKFARMSSLTTPEVMILMPYYLDQQMKKEDLYSFMLSKDKYMLWATVSSLEVIKSTAFLEIARSLNQLVEEEITPEICQVFEKRWNESAESLASLSVYYLNQLP